MRSLPTFSESSFSLSFFLTTPAKKPRTECGCQSVASMMAAIVVPLAWRSIASTVSCFKGEPLPGCADVACAVPFCFALKALSLGGTRSLGRPLVTARRFCGTLRKFRFAGGHPALPPCERQHHVLHCHEPHDQAGQQERGGRRVMAPSGHHTRSFRSRSRAKSRAILWLFW